MSIRKVFGALVVAASTFAPLVALAGTTPSAATPSEPGSACPLKMYHISSVTPYRVEEHMGRATFSRLAGANVFVQATPGLTKEWLQLTLSRHLTEMHTGAMPNCPLESKDVSLSVDSAGTGFAVKIVARDSAKAKEVLRRAQLLLG